MALGAKKLRGWRQGLHATSSTRKEVIGTLRETHDGRKFRYARAGSSDLTAGKMGVAPTLNASLVNQTMAEAVDVGVKVLTLTITAPGTAIAEDYFKGGFFQINDGDGEGIQYPILSSSAVAASGTSITITLENGIVTALTTSSEFTLVPSPWMAVTESTTEESLPVGVAPVDVTANYYYWAQTGGVCCSLAAGSHGVGGMLTLASTAGALAEVSSTFDPDQPICGTAWGTAGVSGEYKPVYLKID